MSAHKSLVLAVLLVLSSVGAVAPVGAAGPNNMVGLPNSNINDSIPQDARGDIPSAAAFQGSVMASKHASSLEATITTTGRARKVMNQSAVPTGNSFAVVLTDDQHHTGREVALPVAQVRQATGSVPDVAYGYHENGSQWTSQVRQEGSLIIFDVPHFSSNTVTFDGTVEITGSPAADGTQYSYDVTDVDSVDNYHINVTGSTGTESDSEQGSDIPTDGSQSVAVGGNLDPTGPATGNSPKLTVRGERRWHNTTLGPSSNGADAEFVLNNIPEENLTLLELEVEDDTSSSNKDYTVNITKGDTKNGVMDAGAASCNQATATDGQWISRTCNVNMDVSTVNAVTVEINWANDGLGQQARNPGVRSGLPKNVQVADGQGTSVALGNWTSAGTNTSTAFNVSQASTSLSVSGKDGQVDLWMDMTERTQTVDPAVEVNGQTTSYTGALSDGQTASLTTDSAWVQSGTNTVNVSVGDGTLSADAPTPQVGLDYSHGAADRQSVTYSSERWSERYNVSHTFSSSRTSTTVTIPFEATVYSVRHVEMRTNGGTWTTLSSSDYSLTNTTLTAQLGSVSAGDEVEVRTAGSKVTVGNGSIQVTSPTTSGNQLDSEITLTSWASDSYIETPDTGTYDLIPHTYSESWDGTEYAIITAGGSEKLYLPGATSDDAATVSTIPVEAAPHTGDVKVLVDSSSATEPTFKVRAGAQAGEKVDYTFVDAQDDTTYVLYSKSAGTVRDQGTANSPLTLSDDDSDETLQFQKDTSSGSSDGGGSTGPLGPIAPSGSSPLNSVPVILIAWAGVVGGIFYLTRKSGLSGGVTLPVVGWSVNPPGGILFWTGTIGSGLFVLEFLSGSVITRSIAQAIKTLAAGAQDVVPALALIGGLLVAYFVYKRYIRGSDTKIVVRGGRE